MLKQIILWMAVCLSSLLSAQETFTVECRLAGDIHINPDNKITLYEIKKGKLVEKATGNCSDENYFAFRFIPAYEGFYMVGNAQNYCYPVWVEKKGAVAISIDRDGGHLHGKRNSVENKVLYEWVELSRPIADRASRGFKHRNQTFREFFDELEKFIPLADQFKSTIKTGNPVFNAMLARLVDYQKDYYAINYLFMPRPTGYVWPEISDYSPYYNQILSGDKFPDNIVLKLPFGFQMLDRYVAFSGRMKEGEADREPDLSLIACPKLRGELCLSRLERMNSEFQFQKILKNEQHFLDKEQQQRANELLQQLQAKYAGQQTIDFTFPDVNGKMVSLSDFKGKVVLLDIWATWCGPCKAELPHLLNLENEMKGTDLVVIGVSIDVKKNYDKWEKMVRDGEVKGIQLFADGGKQLSKDYKVNGIPRFIVFGRDGNIVEAAAPRPSNPDLKELLNELLKKK